MNPQAVLSKTDKGVEEIETRKHKLESKLRTLLIVVNGKTTAAGLAQNFAQRGDVTPLLERLLAEGFVREGAAAGAAAPDAGFEELRAELSQAITAVLGPGGDAISEEIEKCKSLEQLRAYVGGRRAMLEAALGKQGAPFWAKAASLIG